MEGFLTWLEGTGLALSVRESLLLTASLSATHVLGVALLGGAAVMSALRLSGLVFPDRPVREVVLPASRLILVGASISILTGLIQVTPRAMSAAANGFFQLKMLALAAAVLCQITVYRRADAAGSGGPGGATVALGLLASALWITVVSAGSAFILLE